LSLGKAVHLFIVYSFLNVDFEVRLIVCALDAGQHQVRFAISIEIQESARMRC